MAINYGANIFESESTSKAVAHTVLGAVKAGSLICIALTGKRSGAYLNVSSITDTYGNTWAWHMFQSEFRACGVAYCRTSVAMAIGSTITVTWNGTPSYAWKSAHTFEGAGGTPTEIDTSYGTGSTASETVAVTGSDWLVFGSIMLPNATSGGLTLLNSATSRDDNGHSGTTPWAQCFSRNGTSGSTYVGGATLPSSQQWSVCVVSFPYEGLATSPVTRSYAFIPGI